ncbi:MAG TPA: hypothetical protein VG796_29405 [Verrucomicrobiales bacterium]|nr:hypothetical protein [Verrucomicrobiales bacterium]
MTFATAFDGSHRFRIAKTGDNITLSIDVGASGTFDCSVTKASLRTFPS